MALGWRNSIGMYYFAVVQALAQVAVAALLLAVVLVVTPLAGTVVLAGTGLCAYVMFRLSRKLVDRYSRELTVEQRDSGRITHTALYGVRELMIYRQQAAFEARYLQHEGRVAHAQALLPLCHPLPSWTLEWVGMALLLGAVVLLYWQNVGVARTVGTLTLLAAVAWRLLPTMNRLVQQLLVMQQQIPQIEPVLRKLDEVAALPRTDAATAQECPLRNELRLEDVSFRYPNTAEGKPDALRHLHIRIPRGSMVGFVGPSGAGKSTIVGLLTGLFPPSAGQMLVDGQVMDNALREGWIRRIGYVPQSPFLLNASIAENVAFSHWGADIDRDRVRRCCRMAAMDFVDDLTKILTRHRRTRRAPFRRASAAVAIARALYNDPRSSCLTRPQPPGRAAEQATSRPSTAAAHMTWGGSPSVEYGGSCDYVYWIDGGEIRMGGSPQNSLAYTVF